MSTNERKVNGFYAITPNQPKSNTYRSYLIFKLERDWPAMRLGLKNGRKLNRLSTKQLEAKVKQYNEIMKRQLSSYVASLNRTYEAAEPNGTRWQTWHAYVPEVM